MVNFRNIFSTFLVVLTAFSLFAQDSISNYRFRASPYNYGCKHEIPYLATSVGLLATGIILKETNSTEAYTAKQLEQFSHNDVNSFDRCATYNWAPKLSTASDALLYASVLAPALFLTTKPMRKNFGWLMLMSWEVISINYGLTTAVKNLTNRSSPFVYNPNAPLEARTGDDSRRSFYSGHTSNTAAMSFFVASVISHYHPNMKPGLKIALWTVAVVYPGTTAYLRVASGQHFTSDVITAYAVGALTGWIVPFLHKKKNKNFTMAAISINGNAGIYLSYKF